MKKIALIGSTGSIGRQVIDVAARYPDRFQIVAMAANENADRFSRQVEKIRPRFAVLRKESAEISANLRGIRTACGEAAFEEACSYADADIVFVAVTGFAGLKAALFAIEAGKDIALANKESLVVGGELVLQAARKKKVKIIPVDSEHSAIWQCLHFERRADFHKILLTASGGALRDVPLEKLADVTPQQALAHPNWRMGAKITIDCATMLNKGFEVMEAMHLYGAKLSQIEVLVHRESIVHSMVEFADGACLAQMSMPSMELPIQLALSYPQRLCCNLPSVDFCRIGALHFEKPDEKRYPCYSLALACAKEGGTMPCALNAAGEISVSAFLKGQIKYTQIADIIEGTLCRTNREEVQSYAQLSQIDALSREQAAKFL